MIRTILVGLDESPFSHSAVELAIRWARRTGAALAGIAVVDEPTICKPEPTGIYGSSYKQHRDEALLADAHRRVDLLLQQFQQQCSEAAVSCRPLRRVGVPATEILEEEADVELTLLGQQTYFHFETQSAADETVEVVVRNSGHPVVIVPQQLPESRRVIIVYDASPASTRALESFQAADLEDWPAVDVLGVGDNETTALRHAEEGAKYLRFFNLPAQAQPLHVPVLTAEFLLDQVRERDAGLVVMGVSVQSWWAQLLFGSTTTDKILKAVNTLLFLQH